MHTNAEWKTVNPQAGNIRSFAAFIIFFNYVLEMLQKKNLKSSTYISLLWVEMPIAMRDHAINNRPCSRQENVNNLL